MERWPARDHLQQPSGLWSNSKQFKLLKKLVSLRQFYYTFLWHIKNIALHCLAVDKVKIQVYNRWIFRGPGDIPIYIQYIGIIHYFPARIMYKLRAMGISWQFQNSKSSSIPCIAEWILSAINDGWPPAHEAPDHYAGNPGKKKECGRPLSH